ncbi:cytochrome c [Candidatus Methylospira mobilis]|uniref:c-type cytochrome n=1 Tax=Candidatus Methylospira mobilis TaxID=1808979 RepID=UPI0028ECC2C7|nr:cytochrome c [Candidatus Methylospira mobilis]WNV06593.1 cytochrome c [Candidatus Methylospira mobilis]
MIRALIVVVLNVFLVGLSGCSVFEKQAAADTPAAVDRTAYYLCGGCHGPENIRVETMTPNLFGQKKGYLAAKLRDYRDKQRVNPFMNGIAEGLSDHDIDNLAAYFSSSGSTSK